MVSEEIATEDPFLDLDSDNCVLQDDSDIQELIEQIGVENPCTTNELALVEDDLATVYLLVMTIGKKLLSTYKQISTLVQK